MIMKARTHSVIILGIFFLVGNVLTKGNRKVTKESCGLRSKMQSPNYIRNDHLLDVPIWVGECYNIAFVEFDDSSYPCPFTAKLSGFGENQTLSLMIKPEYKLFIEEFRGWAISPNMFMRCINGTQIKIEDVRIEVSDVIPTAPFFSLEKYNYSVPISWPESLPFTKDLPIWARDRDSNDDFRNVKFSVDRPDIVNFTVTPYDDGGYWAPSIDFKIELYLKTENIVPGTYEIILTANDGYNITNVPITVNVEEANCKVVTVLAQSYCFGTNDAPVNFYNSKVTTNLSKGDILDLEGQKIGVLSKESYSFTVDSDFLEINSDGEISFSRNLSQGELDTIGHSYVTQIGASVSTEVNKSTTKECKVPLFISINLNSSSGHKDNPK